MTATLEGGEWSVAHSDRTLPLGKTRYPLYRRLGGPQGRSVVQSKSVLEIIVIFWKLSLSSIDVSFLKKNNMPLGARNLELACFRIFCVF